MAAYALFFIQQILRKYLLIRQVRKSALVSKVSGKQRVV